MQEDSALAPNPKLQDSRKAAEARTTQKPKLFWLLLESKPTAWLPTMPQGTQGWAVKWSGTQEERGLRKQAFRSQSMNRPEPCPPAPSLRQLGDVLRKGAWEMMDSASFLCPHWLQGLAGAQEPTVFLPLTPALAGIHDFLGRTGNAGTQLDSYRQRLSEKEAPFQATIRCLPEKPPRDHVQVDGKAG